MTFVNGNGKNILHKYAMYHFDVVLSSFFLILHLLMYSFVLFRVT